MAQAARCPGSNGDASIAVSTTFSPFLLPIASFEVGFLSQFGTTRPGNAFVSHGLARTSPDVSSAGISAIEYVVFSATLERSAPVALDNYTRIGNWNLSFDDGEELIPELVRVARSKGVSVVAGYFDIGIKRAPEAPGSTSAGSSLSDAVAKKAIASLEDEGFEAVSESKLKSQSGMDTTEMLALVAKRMPFGAHGATKRMMSNARVSVLLRTEGAGCTRNDQGAFIAYVLRNDGEPGVKVDFGSVSLFVIGAGACGRSVEANRSYVRDLVSETKQLTIDGLKGL